MRKSDSSETTHFRSGDRVFCQNGKWFYQTREYDHGPFSTRAEAELDLGRYVDEMDFFNGVRKSRAASKAADAEFANFSLVEKD